MSNIGKALPAAPENSNAREAVTLASEKTAKSGTPKGGLMDGRQGKRKRIGFMNKSIKGLPFDIR